MGVRKPDFPITATAVTTCRRREIHGLEAEGDCYWGPGAEPRLPVLRDRHGDKIKLVKFSKTTGWEVDVSSWAKMTLQDSRYLFGG